MILLSLDIEPLLMIRESTLYQKNFRDSEKLAMSHYHKRFTSYYCVVKPYREM